MGTIAIRREDKVTHVRAKQLGLQVRVSAGWDIAAGGTLFVALGTPIPWELVAAGFGFLAKWDAAAPLWRYGVLAADIGTPAQRQRTEAITLDLRVPVYAPELLFVRDSEAGRALVAAWRAECGPGRDERLAFVRALSQVKPIFCALPRTWLTEAAPEWSPTTARRRIARVSGGKSSLVRVEVAKGRFVHCRPEEAEKVKAQFAAMDVTRRRKR